MLRGVQVINPPEFATHIAMKSYSALPKHYDSNYWIILNYLVYTYPFSAFDLLTLQSVV